MPTDFRRIRSLAAAAVVAPVAVLALAAGDNAPELISVAGGMSGANGECYETSVSNDGKVVAFRSVADNIAGGGGGASDRIYVRDRSAAATTLASVVGMQPFGAGSYNPKVSANGRFVLFQTYTPAIDPPDFTGTSDLYLLDRKLGTLRVVSLNAGGEVGNSDTFLDGASLSANGRYAAVYSASTNLTGDVVSGNDYQVFLLDFRKGTVTLVSKSAMGVAGDSNSDQPSISANGRWVVFGSFASNLVPGGVNRQIYRYDVKRKVLLHASPSATGGMADNHCYGPVVSNPGTVAFTSAATNFFGMPDMEGESDAFLFDPRQGEPMRRLSVTSAGLRPAGDAERCSISQSGTLVAFDSTQPLAGMEFGTVRDVYALDLKTSTLRIVSRNAMGFSANGDSTVYSSSLSANGKWLAYTTAATDVVDGDFNGDVPDVVLVDPRR